MGKKKKSNLLSAKAKRNIFIILMLAYPVLQFIIFWGYVNIGTFSLSFQKFDWNAGDYVFTGFSNYKRVFNDMFREESTKRMLLNSLLYMPINSFVILPLSLIFSYFLFKRVPLSNFFRVIFFLPSILPVVVLTMSFKFTFDPNYGPVNQILKAIFGSSYIPPSWFGEYPTNQIMIFIYCIWAGLGANIVLINGAISRIPQEVIEYGELEGISLFKEFTSVVIPMIWPTITTTFMLGCTAVFTVMMQPLMLTPNNPYTNTIALMIYNAVNLNQDTNYAAAFGIVISLIGAPIILLIRKFMNSRYTEVDY